MQAYQTPLSHGLNRKLYAEIDRTGFYRGTARKQDRSLMNVTFRLATEELEKTFVKESTAAGFDGLKGHRSVGGMRASIYNAFPEEGIDAPRLVHAGVRTEARLSEVLGCGMGGAGGGAAFGGGVAARRPPLRPPARRFRRLDEAAPVLEHLRRVPVNLQPGERFAERTAVHQRLARPRRQVHVGEPPLKREDVAEAFHVAPRERQHAERHRGLLARLPAGIRHEGRRPEVVSDRHEQRPQQDRVGQRLRRLLEPASYASSAASDFHSASPARFCISGAIGSRSRRSASMRNAFSDAPARSSL